MNQLRRRILGFLAAVPFVGTAVAAARPKWMFYEEMGPMAFNPKAVITLYEDRYDDKSRAGTEKDLIGGIAYAKEHGRIIVVNSAMVIDILCNISSDMKLYEAFTPAAQYNDIVKGLFGTVEGVPLYSDAYKHPDDRLFTGRPIHHPIHPVFNDFGRDPERDTPWWVVPNAESEPKVLAWLARPWIEPTDV